MQMLITIKAGMRRDIQAMTIGLQFYCVCTIYIWFLSESYRAKNRYSITLSCESWEIPLTRQKKKKIDSWEIINTKYQWRKNKKGEVTVWPEGHRQVHTNFWNCFLCWKTLDMLNCLLSGDVLKAGPRPPFWNFNRKIWFPNSVPINQMEHGWAFVASSFPFCPFSDHAWYKNVRCLSLMSLWDHFYPASCCHLPQRCKWFIPYLHTGCHKRQHQQKHWGPKGDLGFSMLWCSASKVKHRQHPWNSIQIYLCQQEAYTNSPRVQLKQNVGTFHSIFLKECVFIQIVLM